MLKPGKESLDLGLIVSDIEASLSFYRDTLGLDFVGSVPVWFGTLHRLRYGISDFKLIEHANPPAPGPIGLEAAVGLRYVTFVVTNIEEVCAKMKEMGVTFEKELTEIRPGVRIAMVHDPDKNVVEFVEVAG